MNDVERFTNGSGSVDRRTLMRSGAWLLGGASLAGLVGGCSSDVRPAAQEESTSGGVGAPVTSQPTDAFVRSDSVTAASPLGRQLGLSLVVAEGAIKQFADQAVSGAEEAALEALQALNGGNSAQAVSQMNSFLQRGVGALFVQDLNPSTQVPIIERAIADSVGTFSFNMPAHLQLTASQYEIGRQLAEGTLDHIARNLNNTAKIVHFNFDYNEAVAPRDRGWREVMEGRPAGVEIIADLPANPETQERGAELMGSVLQRDPSVNVVDGGDIAVLGALAALRAAGRGSDPDLALFGVNGDPQAVSEVAAGGPFKATYGFNFAMLGRLVADMSDRWLNGLNIPQLAIVPAIKIDSEDAIAAYERSISDPASAYDTAEGTFFKLYGSTSYATRGTYFNGTVS
jgi:ribose transport system substrate-binding protein